MGHSNENMDLNPLSEVHSLHVQSLHVKMKMTGAPSEMSAIILPISEC